MTILDHVTLTPWSCDCIMQVVNMEDGVGGKFKIGLNSGIEFGLLYDPNEKRDEALVCLYHGSL